MIITWEREELCGVSRFYQVNKHEPLDKIRLKVKIDSNFTKLFLIKYTVTHKGLKWKK